VGTGGVESAGGTTGVAGAGGQPAAGGASGQAGAGGNGGAAGQVGAGGNGGAAGQVGAGGNGGAAGESGAEFGGGGGGGNGGAAGGNAGGGATGATAKLDLLFMIDDSYSMAPLQMKFADAFPSVLQSFLTDPTTGRPADLHVAVVSSSLGGGAWGNVNQCASGSHPGDDGGIFQQGMGGARNGLCTGLNSGETYLVTGDGDTVSPNFSGDIGSVFSCMALLGDQGCGFESQFESVQYALTRAQLPKGLAPAGDPDNGGFLRADARLAIVMLTNEDDCSVPPQSLLLYPGVNSKLDPSGLGALQSYRCNEFGHLCDDPAGGFVKVPPPHDIDMASLGITLNACESAEDNGKTESISYPAGGTDPTMGHLVTVASFVAFLKGLKPDPRDVFVAAIAGPPTPYLVVPYQNPAANNETDPMVQHSCLVTVGATTIYGDPSVRINQWVGNFGANGFFQSICAADFSPTLTSLAAAIHGP
jgi:hypothetical protein